MQIDILDESPGKPSEIARLSPKERKQCFSAKRISFGITFVQKTKMRKGNQWNIVFFFGLTLTISNKVNPKLEKSDASYPRQK